MRPARLVLGLAAAIGVLGATALPVSAAVSPELLASVDLGGAETVAYDPSTQRLFVSNGDLSAFAVVDLSDPSNPTLLDTLEMAAYGSGVTSVAVKDGLVAIGVVGESTQHDGSVVFFDAATLEHVATIATGPLPDDVKFSPDGTMVVSANEGEPSSDYSVDPDGTITVIPISGGQPGAPATIGFTAFNDAQADLEAAGVRIFGPGADLAADLEPEYVAITPDSRTAYVSLQENNAVAVVDLTVPVVTAIVPLGTKDHSVAGNELDTSDRDDIDGNLTTAPLQGMYLPDQITIVGGYIVSANEGDAREYDTFVEESRVKELTLDPTVFPDAEALQADEVLGRINVSTVNADTDDDGDIDVLYSYGARSISVWDASGTLVWDSGSELEEKVLELAPESWDDGRSDNKGPEPEGIVSGTVDGRTYVFVALERTSGIAVWDMTDPTNPAFATIMQPPAGTDVSPEGMVFIASADSPNGRPLLAVSNEVSGTLSIWALGDAPSAPITLPATGSTLALVGLGLTAASLGLVMVRRGRRDAAMN